MAASSLPGTLSEPRKLAFERWTFVGFAIAMIAVTIAGFAPSIVNPSRRLAPITFLVAVHGVLFLLWLLLFLLQASLAATRHVGLHWRMGVVAVVLLAVLVPLSYVVTVQMVRRGFDLSGDQMTRTDPLFGSIFNFVGLIEFALLAGAALAFRRQTEIHKRLMLFANIMLMEVPITHLLGHFGLLSPPAVPAGTALFLLSVVAWEYLSSGRVRPLTAILAASIFLLLPIQGVLGMTAAWHHFAARITR